MGINVILNNSAKVWGNLNASIYFVILYVIKNNASEIMQLPNLSNINLYVSICSFHGNVGSQEKFDPSLPFHVLPFNDAHWMRLNHVMCYAMTDGMHFRLH